MNDLLRDFDDLAGEVDESFAQRARASARSGLQRTPEQAARATHLADKRGLPFGVVVGNLDEFEQREKLDEITDAGKRNPALGEFLSDSRRAALAADDIGNLDRLSQAIRNTLRAGRDYGIGSAWRTWSDHVFDWENIGSGKTGLRAAPDISYVEEVTRHAIAGWHRGQANTALLAGQLGLGDETATAVAYSDSERQAQAAERTSRATDKQFLNLQKANETDSLWESLGLVARSPRAIGAVTAQSLGLGAPGLAATAATGGMGRLATMGAAGASSGSVEAGATIAEVLQDTGIDLTSPAAVAAALRDPETMARARDRATKRGITIGLFDMATAGIAGHFIIGARRGAASAATRVAAETGTQIAGGSVGEAAAQLATGDDLALGDIIVEGVAELPFSAVEARANYVSARERGQVRWLNEQLGIVSRSAEGTAALQAATDAAAQTKLGERSPADLQALAASAGGDGNVYINAEQARVLFQSEPELLVELVGSEEALAEQVALGDVVIPMDRWLGQAKRLPPEATQHARMEPDALSAAELADFDPDALAAEFGSDTSEAAANAIPTSPEARQAIQDDVYGQLIALDRFTPSAAEAQAKIWGDAFSRFGAMSGQDPMALYQRYMGGIRSGRPDGAAPLRTRRFEGDARMDALLESVRTPDYQPDPRQLFGDSLSAWLRAQGGVIDEGGELRGMDAGKQRIGLVNSAGMPLDRARELAAEAGYLPADSDINDLLELIDRDLREGDAFSEQQGDRGRQAFDAERQQLLDAIADNPTLSAMSPEEFRALTNQQIADALFGGSMMDQSALNFDQPSDPAQFDESAFRPAVVSWAQERFGDLVAPNGRPAWQNFVAWFGDSQAVDSAGAPLVVYHGTDAEFEVFSPSQSGTFGRGMYFADGASEAADVYGERVVPAYLKMENPWEVEADVESQAAYDEDHDHPSIEAILTLPSGRRMLDRAKRLGSPHFDSDLTNELVALGYDGVIATYPDGSREYVVFEPAQIKSATGNSGAFDPSNPSILYQDALDPTESYAFKVWSNEAPLISSNDALSHDFKSGEKIVVESFHGTRRPDRIGDKFNPKRATSGPMAYFTSSPDVASNYATGKADTSIDTDEYPFEAWFKVKVKGARNPVNIDQAWLYLDPDVKSRIRENAPKITTGEDGDTITLDPEATDGLGNYGYELQQTRTRWGGDNPLKALVESWLNSGSIYGEEQRFMQVLELAGMPMGGVTFDSPYAEYPAVYPVFVAMRNPLVSTDIPVDVMDALEVAAKRDRSRAIPQEHGADSWDKRTITLRQWVADMKAGDDFVWTRIPDKVTEVFKSLGYDGIVDIGGKMGGASHRVYIPFGEKQVKSAIANRGTFDSSKSSILYQDALPDDATAEQLRERIAELEKELRTDGLTGLRNWRAFTEDETLGWSEVASFDLDGLKRVNDTFGHEAGDEMLRQAAGVFLAGERDGVRFYRKGGDEFAMRARDPKVAAALAQEIVDRLESVDVEFVYQGERIEYRGIGAGYGIAQSFEEADQRLNADKQRREAAGLREARAADGAPRRARRVSDRAEGRESDRRGAQPVAAPEAQDGRAGLLDRARLALRSLFQSETPKAPRGQIEIFPDRRMAISLFEKADRSTFLHESAHFFFEVYGDIAAMADADPRAKDDFDKLLQWGAIDGDTAEARLAAWQGMDINARRDLHEKVARGFEAYLFEGKAPSPELRGVFGQFKAWFFSLYRNLRALNVELTDDVRGVFDRMLASDEEIEAAQVRQGMEPLFTAPAEAGSLGLSEAQLARYRAMLAEATDEAKADAFRKLLQAHERERNRWYKEEKAKVSAEVTAEYEATPAVRALRILSGRKTIDGIEVPEGLRGLKLDKAALVALYGEPYLKRLGRTYAVSGGVHPSEAAQVLGFESGEALVLALAQVPDTLARVDAEVEARMRERYGDPMADGTLAEVAMDAVHNSHRVRLLEWEMRTLQELASDPTAQPEDAPRREQAPRERAPRSPEARASQRAAAARRSLEMRQIAEAARRRIDGRTARQLRPNDYLAAERRAAREAATAAAGKNYAAALLAKRRQAFNAAMYRAARDAQDRFEKHARYLRRFTHGNARAALGKAGQGYLDQVDTLLEGLEIKPVSGRQVDRRQRLAEWVAKQEADGNPIDVPQALLDETALVNIRDMTVADLQGVVDTIRQIEHLARLKNKLRLAGTERDREEVDTEMAASVAESFAAQPERTGDKTWRETAAQRLGDLDVQRLLPTNIARELDGYQEGGPVWTHVIKPIRDAIFGKVIPETTRMQEAVAELYRKHYNEAEIGNLDAPVFRAEVGDSWSKGRILSLAMNWGSEGNAEAILSQAHSRLTEEQVAALLGKLDARDYAFVQDMVDLVNSYWPQIAETQRRRTGIIPPKVEGRPFTVYTADGQHVQVRGGYFPLKYDADRSGYGATQQEIDDVYNDLRVGRSARAATKNGHTIERVDSGGKTVNLGLDIATAHMRDVIRDIHLGDAVAYVHTVLKGHAFTEAVIAAGKRHHLNALQLWLKDVAAGEMGPRSAMESFVRFVRQNTTAAVLAWKASSAMLQVTGLFQTASIIGNRAMLRGVARLLGKSWVGPHSIWNDIRARSPYMVERFGNIPDAVQVVSNARDGKLKSAHAAMIRWGYIPMARMQMIADAATWLAGEAEGLRLFDGDVAKARAYADDLVIRAQSADNFIDKSAVQRGTLDDKHRQSELVKATTMLLSYMIAKGNVAREKYQAVEFTKPLQVAKFTADMVQLFALETLVVALLSNGLPDDEDDDGYLDDWLAYLAKETGFGLLSTIPLVSQLGTEGRGYTAQGVLERTYGTFDDATGAWLDGELNWRDGRTAINLAGVATGIPSSQINTTADALWRVRDGEDVAPIEFLIRAQKPRD
jgi:diguanylate cyclase (GGDEF)-like protein